MTICDLSMHGLTDEELIEIGTKFLEEDAIFELASAVPKGKKQNGRILKLFHDNSNCVDAICSRLEEQGYEHIDTSAIFGKDYGAFEELNSNSIYMIKTGESKELVRIKCRILPTKIKGNLFEHTTYSGVAYYSMHPKTDHEEFLKTLRTYGTGTTGTYNFEGNIPHYFITAFIGLPLGVAAAMCLTDICGFHEYVKHFYSAYGYLAETFKDTREATILPVLFASLITTFTIFEYFHPLTDKSKIAEKKSILNEPLRIDDTENALRYALGDVKFID